MFEIVDENMKLCKNCKHYQHFDNCRHKENMKKDVIEGEMVPWITARAFRDVWTTRNACGPEAKFFEVKEDENV